MSLPSSADPRAPRRTSSPIIVCIIFFFSGAASLVYEVVWMRQLTLIFGVSTYAVSTILAIFMGGLAAGSYLFGRASNRISKPLIAYAILEACIGLYAFFIDDLFGALRGPYIALYRMDMPHLALVLTRGSLVAAVLLPPTILMGGTLPLLARYLIQRREDIGRQTALLYFVNTAGAVAGCAVAGFLFIEHLGLQRSIHAAATMNFLLAGATIALSSLVRTPAAAPVLDRGAAALSATTISPFVARVTLAAIGISGFASLAHEVVWTRALLRYLYNSTYAFTTMLVIFLTGLAIGSWLFTVLPGRKTRPVAVFAALELGAGFLFVLSANLFLHLPEISNSILGEQVSSFGGTLTLLVLRSAMILLLPAVCLGAAIPAAAEILSYQPVSAGITVGRVYAVNTLGAILGAISANFLLIPVLGMFHTLATLIGLNILVAGALLFATADSMARKCAVTALTATAILCGVLLLPADLFRRTFTPTGTELVYYREGATDTVGVVQAPDGHRVIQYEDKRGTSATFAYQLNFLLGHFPVLIHPGEPKTALHICFGVGNSLSALAASPSIERVDSIELSPQILDAAHYFWTNNDVLRNPKVNTIIDDGRNYVLATQKTYDVIVIEPPEIFTSGVINLYTKEFYQDVYRCLADDGVFVQWVPIGEGSQDEEKMLLRSFYEVFPNMTVWVQLVEDMTILLAGTKHPQRYDYGLIEDKMSRPRVKDDLLLCGLGRPDGLLRTFLFGPEVLDAYLSGVTPVTDDRTKLDFSMPRYLGSGYGLGAFNANVHKEGTSPRTVATDHMAAYVALRTNVRAYMINYPESDPMNLSNQLQTPRKPTPNFPPKIRAQAEWNRWPNE